MKALVLALVASVFFLNARAEAVSEPETILLTPEQFLSLTHAEQRSYVRTLRELFVEMSETNPQFAEELSRRSTLFAQLYQNFVPDANAQAVKYQSDEIEAIGTFKYSLYQAALYTEDLARQDISKLSDQEKAAWEKKFEQSIKYMASAGYQVKASKSPIESPKAREEESKKLDQLQSAVDKNYEQLKKMNPKSPLLKEWDGTKAKFANGTIEATPKGYPGFEEYTGPLLKKDNPTKKTKAAKASKPSKQSDDKTEMATTNPEKSSGGYRCMYAGFVIKGEKCIAPSELPWMVDGLNTVDGKSTSQKPKNFKCEDGKVMCNPFIFGAEVACDLKRTLPKEIDSKCLSTSKPFCVRPSATATKDCNSLASKNNDTSIELAVHLMGKSAQNKAAAKEFAMSFDELCDKDNVDYSLARSKAAAQRDIKSTCAIAKKRLDEVKKKYQFDAENKKDADRENKGLLNKKAPPKSKGVK